MSDTHGSINPAYQISMHSTQYYAIQHANMVNVQINKIIIDIHDL